MLKKLNQSLLILAGFILFLGASQAEELTANAGVTSNYVFRGVTQTDNGFAAQGGIDWVHESNLYLGAWASNVDNATNNDGFEIDLYAGFTFDLGNDNAIDIGYIAYEYTNGNFANDVQEVFIGFTFKELSVTYYDADTDNNGVDYYYLDVKYVLELQNEIKLGFHYGHYEEDVAANNDADDISISLSTEFQDLDVSLTFTSYDSDNSAADEDEIFVTVTRTFDL